VSVSVSNNHGGIIAVVYTYKLQGSSERYGGCGEWLRSAAAAADDDDGRALKYRSYGITRRSKVQEQASFFSDKAVVIFDPCVSIIVLPYCSSLVLFVFYRKSLLRGLAIFLRNHRYFLNFAWAWCDVVWRNVGCLLISLGRPPVFAARSHHPTACIVTSSRAKPGAGQGRAGRSGRGSFSPLNAPGETFELQTKINIALYLRLGLAISDRLMKTVAHDLP
jgi:hypothetical protein